jgi:hypothetical protein
LSKYITYLKCLMAIRKIRIQALILIIFCVLAMTTLSCQTNTPSVTSTKPITTSSNSTSTSTTTSTSATTSQGFKIRITVSPDEGGSVTADPGSTNLATGTNVKLTAIPASGYLFERWTEDIKSRYSNVTLYIDGNKNVTATFTMDLDALAKEALSRSKAKIVLETDSHALAVDIRSSEDYQKGHVPGAISLPENMVNTQYTKIPEGYRLLVYTGCG